MSDSNPILKQIIHVLEELQAINIKVLDVREQTTITDYMIIASGRASRHVKAIAQKLIEEMKKKGLPALHSSGIEQGDWALIDFGDYVLHIMQPDCREFYNLEELWDHHN